MIINPQRSNTFTIIKINSSTYSSFLDFMACEKNAREDSQEIASTNESELRYPVTVVFCGSNLYRSTLLDVDGKYMQTNNGENMNVFCKIFAKSLQEKQIRLMHCVNPGYRFFITSSSQYNLFCQVRNEGWSHVVPGVCFYVYDDEDCSYLSDHFKGAILAFE